MGGFGDVWFKDAWMVYDGFGGGLETSDDAWTEEIKLWASMDTWRSISATGGTHRGGARTAPPTACHRRAENETRDALADAELGEAEVVDEIAGEGPQQAF